MNQVVLHFVAIRKCLKYLKPLGGNLADGYLLYKALEISPSLFNLEQNFENIFFPNSRTKELELSTPTEIPFDTTAGLKKKERGWNY